MLEGHLKDVVRVNCELNIIAIDVIFLIENLMVKSVFISLYTFRVYSTKLLIMV